MNFYQDSRTEIEASFKRPILCSKKRLSACTRVNACLSDLRRLNSRVDLLNWDLMGGLFVLYFA